MSHTTSSSQTIRVWSIDLERGWRGGENQVYLLQRGLRELQQAPAAKTTDSKTTDSKDSPDQQPSVISTVVARCDQPLATRLQQEHLSVQPARSSWHAYRLLRAAVRAGEVDIIHAHTGRSHRLALWAARGSRSRVVVTRRVDFALGASPRKRAKYDHRVTSIVAISQAIATVLTAGGVERDRIELIPSGVDPDCSAVSPAPIREQLGLSSTCPVVLCAAAFVAHKGHRVLLDAWATVEAQHPDAVLLLAGSGELESALRQQAERLDLKRLHFLGWRDDAPALLRASDVFALASVEEGLGTALIDAAFARVPIAATTAGGIPEVVDHQQSGLLAPVEDSTALAQHLMQMLGDRALATRLSEAAFTRAEERFHYRAMATRYLELYRRICKDRQ